MGREGTASHAGHTLSPVAATLMLVQGQSGLGVSWAVVCHSEDMQGAFGVAFAAFIPRQAAVGRARRAL